MANGSRHSLRYVEEVVYGTTPASPAFKTLRHNGATLALNKETLQSEELRDDRMIADVRHGAFSVGGEIPFELSFGSFDDWLAAALCGDWVGNDLKAGVGRKSFTVERYFGDMLAADKPYHRFTGVEVNSLQLQVNSNAMVTGTFSVLGQGMSLGAAIIAGATYAPAPGTSPVDSFTGTLLENGVAIAVVTEIQLSVENGLETRYVVGSKETLRPSIARSNVSGNVTAFFENSTLLEKFINETESAMSFTLPDGAGNSLTFFLPRIKYMGGAPDVSGEGPVTLSMPFQALYDATENTNLVITRDPV